MADNGYSAKVVLRLLVNGAKLALSHVGPSGLVIKDDCEPMPSGNATLVIKVDQVTRRRQVYLPHGVPGPRQPVQFF
jgi:hypothetical protein